MTHQQIQQLLFKYRAGTCTKEESAKIHKWYRGLNEESLLSLNDYDRELLENKLLERIWENIRDSENDQEIIPVNKWWKSAAFYSGIAATVIISLGYIWFLNRPQSALLSLKEPVLLHTVNDQMIVFENTTQTDQRLTLEDRSENVLSPGSKIVYPDKFAGDKREVQLVGDAFFEITKNPAKPFLVYSGNLITRVLGTSFRIKSKVKDHVEVEVVTGRVSVFENKEIFEDKKSLDEAGENSAGVVLTPNQRVTYFIESRHLITSLVADPVMIAASSGTETLVFSNTLLPDIVAGLQQEYGIEIVLANENIGKCTFTGDLSDLSLYEKLELICKSNSAVFEVKGTRILISGTGCEDANAKDNLH
jgi:transmembrane sensor